MKRPSGSNADEWCAFIEECGSATSFLACQIASAIEDAQRAASEAPSVEVVPTLQQISDYLHGLDAIKREVVEREARAMPDGVGGGQVPEDRKRPSHRLLKAWMTFNKERGTTEYADGEWEAFVAGINHWASATPNAPADLLAVVAAEIERAEVARNALRDIANGGLWGTTDKEAWANVRKFAREAVRKTSNAYPLPADVRPRREAEREAAWFTEQIFNGIESGLVTIDTVADETLANVMARGQKAVTALRALRLTQGTDNGGDLTTPRGMALRQTGEFTDAALARLKGDDGWIEWKGGACPVNPVGGVTVRLRSGWEEGPFHAEVYRWGHDHDDSPADIIAYKFVQAETEAP